MGTKSARGSSRLVLHKNYIGQYKHYFICQSMGKHLEFWLGNNWQYNAYCIKTQSLAWGNPSNHSVPVASFHCVNAVSFFSTVFAGFCILGLQRLLLLLCGWLILTFIMGSVWCLFHGLPQFFEEEGISLRRFMCVRFFQNQWLTADQDHRLLIWVVCIKDVVRWQQVNTPHSTLLMDASMTTLSPATKIPLNLSLRRNRTRCNGTPLFVSNSPGTSLSGTSWNIKHKQLIKLSYI